VVGAPTPVEPDPAPAAAESSAAPVAAPGSSDDGEPDGAPTPAPGRPTFRVPLPEGPASRYLRDLPAIFQDEDPGGPGGGGTLVVTRDGAVLRTLALGERVITVGRLPGNDLVLPDASVSDRHAEVRAEAARVTVLDVGSAGGTRVDGVPLPRDTPAALDRGAVVRVGPYELTYKRPRPNDFLGRMLLIFEALWEPLEQRQDHIALYYDPRTAPAAMLPWIASWLDLALDHHWPEERRRRLLREAMDLYRWRGTSYGLARMLEVSAGVAARVTDDPAEPWVVRVEVTLPPAGEVRREAVEALVRAHKPAHVGYVLEFLP
jgi:phage tail-like protein